MWICMLEIRGILNRWREMQISGVEVLGTGSAHLGNLAVTHAFRVCNTGEFDFVFSAKRVVISD